MSLIGYLKRVCQGFVARDKGAWSISTRELGKNKRQEKQRVSKVVQQGTGAGKLREQANTCQFWEGKKAMTPVNSPLPPPPWTYLVE